MSFGDVRVRSDNTQAERDVETRREEDARADKQKQAKNFEQLLRGAPKKKTAFATVQQQQKQQLKQREAKKERGNSEAKPQDTQKKAEQNTQQLGARTQSHKQVNVEQGRQRQNTLTGQKEQSEERKQGLGKGEERATERGKVLAKASQREAESRFQRGDQRGSGGDSKREDSKEAQKSYRLPPGVMFKPREISRPAQTAPSARTQAAQEIVDKIVEQVRVGTNVEGGKELQMDFKSDVFGGLRLHLSQGKRGLSTKLYVSDDESYRKLSGSLDTLKEELKKKNIRVDDIEIVLER